MVAGDAGGFTKVILVLFLFDQLHISKSKCTGHLSKNENNRKRKSGWYCSSLMQDHAQVKGQDSNAGT